MKVNGVNGIMLFPDTFTWPDNSITKPTTLNTYESNWNGVDYSTVQFAVLENAGVVFLPAAGYRDGTSVNNVGSYGNYWSATYDSAYFAYYLHFRSNYVDPHSGYPRYRGSSVRLVQDTH